MKNQLPTFEEFRSETKKKLKLSLLHLNDKELEKFMDSEVDEIRESYERNKKEFEDGEINIDQFMISGTSSLAYALDMMYWSGCQEKKVKGV